MISAAPDISIIEDFLLADNRKPQYHRLSFFKRQQKATLWENTLQPESYSTVEECELT